MATSCFLLASSVNCLLVDIALAQVDPHTGQALKEVDVEQASQVKLEAQERHRARMKAHRKRIIETGKNDHVSTPEEYSPELEEYSKFRNAPSGHKSLNADNDREPQAEVHTDIKLESEKPGPAKIPDQYVSKRMKSEANKTDTTDKIDMKAYMAEVSRRIKAGWSPPARHENKTVAVSFLVMPNGAVGNLLITQSSGSAAADKAARHAILRAAPFTPLPKGCTQPQAVDYTFDHTAQLDNPSYQMGVH